jgi:ribonuclease P protein component
MIEEASREAHIPAQQPTSSQEARFPCPDGHPSRPQHPSSPSAQGPRSNLGLIWRIRDRRSFAELRRHGLRARHGCVSVTFAASLDAPVDEPPRLAFAIPRKVGSAVVRNTIRRRVRGHLIERQRIDGFSLASGAYLLAFRPGAAEESRESLLASVDRCLDRVAGSGR